MLEKLCEHNVWTEYFSYKKERNLLDKDEEKRLYEFVYNKKYENIAQGIINGTYEFGIPERKELSKMGTDKKRIVYTFSEEENMILKLLSYLLYKYDDCLSPNCYAFRREIGSRRAITDLLGNEKIIGMNSFKADISNYFNSIDIDILSDILSEVVNDDEKLLDFLLKLLRNDKCRWQNEIISEKKGVMAGTPTSPFFANLYLREMDRYFYDRNVCYIRYSDDIIIFDEAEKLNGHISAYRAFIEKYRLRSNPDKEQLFEAGSAWSFLGFEMNGSEVDISPVTVRKLMGKIRRSARSLRRWMLKNSAEPERALKAFNRKFNRKFYSNDCGHELCWTRWFFPLINSDASLKTIDAYMQQYQRYLVTGSQKKSACAKVPYSMLKDCGYRPLVAEFYKNRYSR